MSSSTSNPTSARVELGFLRTQHVAEESMIDIIPRFSSSPLRFLTHTIGPFRTSLPISVPLWLAIQLRIQHRCRISPPAWLDAAALLHHLSLEKASPLTFQPLPFHYIEVARLLLQHARDDLTQPERIEEALSDVMEARRKKIHDGLMNFSAQAPTTIKLNNVAAMEIESIREMSTAVLRQFWLMQHHIDHAAGHSSRQQQPQPSAAAVQRRAREDEGASQSQRDEERQARSSDTAVDPPQRLRRYR